MKQSPHTSIVPIEDPPSIRERLAAILSSDPFINGVVTLAVTIGFFHGWLKIHFPNPVTTFIFDVLLCGALFLSYTQMKRGQRFIPYSPVGNALKAFYILCFLYLLLPWRPPLLISVAAIRGWCFATLIFALGYQLTHSLAQVKGYFYVLIILGVATALYGLQQTPEEIERMIRENAIFAERYQYQFYATKEGRQLRVFSTFVSSGGFGGTMAYIIVFILALFSERTASVKERVILLAALIPISYGMVLSGARSALMSLGVGFIIIAWHRRSLVSFVVFPACILMAIKFGASVTQGSMLDRYSTMLDFQEVWERNYIPTWIGWDYMAKGHWLGGGLGRSGYSVPFFLAKRMDPKEITTSDGDLGRLMIEMGIPGLLLFGGIIWAALRSVFSTLNQLRGTALSSVALASAGCILMAIVSLPSGSPFLGIPMGAMVWFFLGTLQKLSDIYAKAQKEAARSDSDIAEAEDLKRFLYHHTPQKKKAKGPLRFAK